MKLAGIASVAMAIAVQSAAAVELSQRGSTAYLSGPIKAGDDVALRAFLARPEAHQIRVLSLSSPGGKVFQANDMAQQIRAAGLTTLVDASHAACNSACTGLFAAGVRRIYLNAGGIVDGVGGPNRGIGFHEGNNGERGRKAYSGRATAQMIDTYYAMGVPGAATLATKATFNRLYRVSGATALSLGIATSLSGP